MNGNNTDVVIIQLDRPREIRYGHKALKALKALTGMRLVDIENQLLQGDIDPDIIEKMIYAGLLKDAENHNETLTLEKVADLLDEVPVYADVIMAVAEAFIKGFAGSNTGNAGESPAPSQEQSETVNMTSTKA